MLTSDKESIRLVTSPTGSPEAPGINVLPAVLLPLAGPEEYDLDVRSEFLLSYFSFRTSFDLI